GLADSLFSNPKNWCEEDMPLAHHTVLVPAGTAHQPVIDFPTSLAGLVLSPSAQLTLNSSLVLTDTLSAAPSSIAATQGKFIWQGSKDLGLDGRIFGTKGLGELVLSNSGKVVLTDSLLLNKGLSLHQGKLETNGLLQLKKGARLFPAGPSAMLDGFAHVEFSLSPFNQTSAWVGLPFSHFFNSENFSAVVSQASSFALPIDTNGLVLDSVSLVLTKTSPWLSHQSLFIKQTPTSLLNTPTSPATPHYPSLWLSGQLNMGNHSLTLTKKPVPTGVWLKNPYLHEVNLAKLGGYARPWIWVWDPSGGQEGMFNLLSAASAYRLSPFESFLVMSPKEQDENLAWTESAKWLDTDKIDAATKLSGSLHSFAIEWFTNGQLQDRAYAFDHPQSASRIDSLDAPKPTQPGTNLFFWSTDGKKLAADVRRWTPNTTLDLGFSQATRGEHLLKIQEAHLPKDMPWVVFDRYHLRSFPLQTDSSYVFQVNNDSLSRDPHRFMVTSALRLPQAERLVRDFSVKLYPNPVHTELYMEWQGEDSQNLMVEILGSNGIVLKRYALGTVKQGRFKLPLNHLGPGVYFLRVQGGEHQKTIRFLKAN
ncbi:MAG: T9SS C-terminal target domain-containing protein, partial [Sphingobacteriia bacterium]